MKKIFQKLLPKILGTKLNITSYFNSKKAALEAFIIFCAPRGGKVLPEQEVYLNNAKLEILEHEERTLQSYHWEGTGKKVLLIHGWESNTHRWHLLIKELQQKNYNIYAIDAPAHGNSSGRVLNVPRYAAAIETAVKAYNPEIIISHSIGALATIFHQHTYNLSNGLKKLVLLGAPSELNDIMQDYKKILGLNSRMMKALEVLVIDRFGYNFKEFSGAAFAKAIKIPTLIIHDKLDKITPVNASRSIHKNIPTSTYIETEGFGHSLYQDDVRTAVLKFIR